MLYWICGMKCVRGIDRQTVLAANEWSQAIQTDGVKSRLGLFRGDGLSRLLYTDLPNLLEICNPEKHLSDPVLHESCHSIPYGLLPQYLHFCLTLDQGLHLIGTV